MRSQPLPALHLEAPSRTRTEAGRAAVLDSRFKIYDREVRLAPPVDWAQDGPNSFRSLLHSWHWMDPLLESGASGNEPAYEIAVGLARDWITQNTRPGPSRYSWSDKVVGDRSGRLGFLARLGAGKGWITDDDARLLVDAILDHGSWLDDDANYQFGKNHGLFQDAGLAQLASYASAFADDAPAWKQHAVERFRASLAHSLNEAEGMHLEHSVAYQFHIMKLVRNVLSEGAIGEDPELRSLADRMDGTAGWLLQPDGRLSQIGDTNRTDGTKYQCPLDYGLRFMPQSGWAIVKLPESYLIVTAAFNSNAHKHADELSFELYEGGQRVIADSGKYAYQSGNPFRDYARSAEAHNGLVIDSFGGSWFRGQDPYGSGMLAAGHGDDWYAILGTNPLAERRGVRHERLFLYAPARALMILDTVAASDEHAYTRLFHLDPDIRARGIRAETLTLKGSSFEGSMRDWADGSKKITRGLEAPVQGWAFPEEGVVRKTDTISFTTRHESGTDVTTIALRDMPLTLENVDRSDSGASVTIGLGEERTQLEVTRDGEELAVRARAE